MGEVQVTPPDPAREAAILARCEAATKGPWVTDCEDGLEDFRVVVDTPEWRATQGGVAEVIVDRLGQDDNEANDAEFCAHAREDVPWLLAQLTAARARVRALEGAVQCPAEWCRRALAVAGPSIHDTDKPSGNITFEVTTSRDVAEHIAALAARGE